MSDNKDVVKRSVLELQRELGNVISVDDLFGKNPEVSQEDILLALDELKSEGLINFLDENTIQVNI